MTDLKLTVAQYAEVQYRQFCVWTLDIIIVSFLMLSLFFKNFIAFTRRNH